MEDKEIESITLEIKRMHARMDSFVNQIDLLTQESNRCFKLNASFNMTIVNRMDKQETKSHMLAERIEGLEKYFSKYNFEDSLSELSMLDKEYQNKVAVIISKITSNKSLTSFDYDLFFTLLEEAYIPTNTYDNYLSVRTINCLRGGGFEFLGDIICNKNLGSSYFKLLRLENFGKKSYKELLSFLQTLGYGEEIDCEEYWRERKIRSGVNFVRRGYLYD